MRGWPFTLNICVYGESASKVQRCCANARQLKVVSDLQMMLTAPLRSTIYFTYGTASRAGADLEFGILAVWFPKKGNPRTNKPRTNCLKYVIFRQNRKKNKKMTRYINTNNSNKWMLITRIFAVLQYRRRGVGVTGWTG